MKEFEELWDDKELCRRLKLKPSYVRDLRYMKRIPFIKIGRLVRYVPEDIYAWIATGACSVVSKFSEEEAA